MSRYLAVSGRKEKKKSFTISVAAVARHLLRIWPSMPASPLPFAPASSYAAGKPGLILIKDQSLKRYIARSQRQ